MKDGDGRVSRIFLLLGIVVRPDYGSRTKHLLFPEEPLCRLKCRSVYFKLSLDLIEQ